jgi:hypothetical protein
VEQDFIHVIFLIVSVAVLSHAFAYSLQILSRYMHIRILIPIQTKKYGVTVTSYPALKTFRCE